MGFKRRKGQRKLWKCVRDGSCGVDKKQMQDLELKWLLFGAVRVESLVALTRQRQCECVCRAARREKLT